MTQNQFIAQENKKYQTLLDRYKAWIKRDIKQTVNVKYILKFDEYLDLDRKTIATRQTNIQRLYYLFKEHITKDWKKLTKKDFETIVKKIDNSEQSEKTKSNYKKLIKHFDKWLNGGEESSKATRWIKGSPQKRKLNNLQRSDLLTDEDKKILLQACKSLKDKALISLWFETGMRPKELMVLTLGSVTFEKKLAYITLPQDTKTGSRTIPIYFSKPPLLDYINTEHPKKNDMSAPLWVDNKGNVLKEEAFRSVLRKVKARSGIKKRLYLYLGRHSSYTQKSAQGWNEAIIKQFHGIDQSSTVLNRYIHLSGKDVANKVSEYYGLEVKKTKESGIKLVQCVNCNTENQSTDMRCSKCGYILDPKLMNEELKKKEEAESEVSELKKQVSDQAKIMEEISKTLKLMQEQNKK